MGVQKARCTQILQENGVSSAGDRGPAGLGGGSPDYQHATDHGGVEPGTMMIRERENGFFSISIQ